MPRIKTEKYTVIQEDGEEELAVSYEVDGKGLFTAQVPDYLEAVLRAHLEPNNQTDRSYQKRTWGDMDITRPRKHLRVEGTQLHALESLVSAAVEGYNEPEIDEELVLIYCYSGEASIWQTPTGEYAPNGVVAAQIAKRDGTAPSEWPGSRYGNWLDTGSTSANNPARHGYMVRFGAKGALKRTVRRGPSVKVEYDSHLLDLPSDHPIALLNSFTSVTVPDPGASAPIGLKPQEIPYSVEAAEFFYNRMMQLAVLHAQMYEFFNLQDPQAMLAEVRKGLTMSTPELPPGGQAAGRKKLN